MSLLWLWVIRKFRELSSHYFASLSISASSWLLLEHSTLVDGELTVKRARATTMPRTSHRKSGKFELGCAHYQQHDRATPIRFSRHEFICSVQPQQFLISSDSCVNVQSFSNRRGDLDGEKVVKVASKADCVLALNGESCMLQLTRIGNNLCFQLTPLRFIHLRTNALI